jgi:putative membrane protein
MIKFLNQPGFLGTRAPFLSDLTLILILLTAILFTIGWQLARHKHFEAHRWVQTSSASLNAVVVLVVMIRSFVVHILPGIPGKLLQGDYAVTTVHALVGAIGLLLGIFVVLRANKLVPQALRFKKYKPFMRTAYALYMAATLFGVIVYTEAFIIGI